MEPSLTTQLSQLFVGLVIEADNEYERRTPNRLTMDHGSVGFGGAWLISSAMYFHFLRYVPAEGIRMADLANAAGVEGVVHSAYHGMRRWGYTSYTPDIAGSTPKKKDGDALVRLTPNGVASRATWAAVYDDLEKRWSDRGLEALRDALGCVDGAPVDFLPLQGWLLDVPKLTPEAPAPVAELGLVGRISRLLTAIAYEVDGSARLPIGAVLNLLRPIGDDVVPVKDLPARSGVARKAWSSAVGQLEKMGLAATEPLSTGRGKQVRLTIQGQAALRDGIQRLATVEGRWAPQTASVLNELGSAINHVRVEAEPGCWRHKVPITSLPWFPLVSHRGGYPDGA